MSTTVQITQSWPGFSEIKTLVVFGDSYSSVDMFGTFTTPTAEQPLGVPFPGTTWADPEEPNWVGYLISKYAPKIRYDPVSKKAYRADGGKSTDASPILVYDFAVGGDTVAGVQNQVERKFQRHVANSDSSSTPWAAKETLYVTWVGINDCALSSGIASSIKSLFALQENLYETGARNFLFIDVPPINRSPAVPAHVDISAKYNTWNEHLLSGIEAFSASHSDITALLFSSHATFTHILDNPVTYGFARGDVRRRGGIWFDHLHPTSKTHDIVARDLAAFLGGVNVKGEPGI